MTWKRSCNFFLNFQNLWIYFFPLSWEELLQPLKIHHSPQNAQATKQNINLDNYDMVLPNQDPLGFKRVPAAEHWLMKIHYLALLVLEEPALEKDIYFFREGAFILFENF